MKESGQLPASTRKGVEELGVPTSAFFSALNLYLQGQTNRSKWMLIPSESSPFGFELVPPMNPVRASNEFSFGWGRAPGPVNLFKVHSNGDVKQTTHYTETPESRRFHSSLLPVIIDEEGNSYGLHDGKLEIKDSGNRLKKTEPWMTIEVDGATWVVGPDNHVYKFGPGENQYVAQPDNTFKLLSSPAFKELGIDSNGRQHLMFKGTLRSYDAENKPVQLEPGKAFTVDGETYAVDEDKVVYQLGTDGKVYVAREDNTFQLNDQQAPPAGRGFFG